MIHPCVLLIVAIVHPAYPAPVVLFLVFTQPLVAVSSLSRASLAVGSNFQMLVRLFTGIASLVSAVPKECLLGSSFLAQALSLLVGHRVVVLQQRESACHQSLQTCQHFWELLLCRQVFLCHLETRRARRIALLHVHVFETLIDVSFRCYESVP